MQILPAALQRVRTAPLRAEAIATIFESLAQHFEQCGEEAATYTLGYQNADDFVSEGDLVPVIVLSVRPAFKKEETDA